MYKSLREESLQYARPPWESERYTSSLRMLRAINDHVARHGSKLAVVLIPSKHQVLEADWAIRQEIRRDDRRSP